MTPSGDFSSPGTRSTIFCVVEKRSTDYRLAVYSFYRNHTERKERENFLKHYHGEYSGYSGGNDDVTYQLSRGVLLQPWRPHPALRQGGAEMERCGKACQRHDRPGAVPFR